MKTKQIFLYICILALSVLSVSCLEDEYLGGDGTMQVSVSATLEIDGDESRATLSDELNKDNITKYCFLYFEGTGNDAKLLASYDVTTFPAKFTLKAPLSGKNRAILLGNVNLSQLGTITKLGDLNDKTYSIDHTYNNPQSLSNFTWSAYKDVTRSTSKLDFVLNPNMAKINIILVDNSTESQVVNLRMKRVRDKVRYSQSALYKGGNSTENSVVQADRTYVNYDMEDMNLSKTGTNFYSWYVSHNEPIHVSGTNYSRESGIVPAGSTFLEIDGLKNNSNLTTSYRIYPGVKKGSESYLQLDNFKVVGGCSYTITVTINNDGITTNIDSYGNRLDYYNTSYKIKLPSNNNCYMIHPKVQKSATGQTVYEMPIHQRINEYWGTNWGYTGVGNVSSNVIGDNTEWVAEVIWQDIQGSQLLYFSDEVGGDRKNTYEGVGKNPLYFTLNTTFVDNCLSNRSSYNDRNDIYGNILVGVRKKNESAYLWSWHLWVTDYYPYETPAYSGGALEYGSGTDYQGYYHRNETETEYTLKKWGNVHHYGHNDSYDNDYMGSSWKWSSHHSDDVWDGEGIYATKWMMDRNLGSQSPTNLGGREPLEAFGLYYQYGRKDPIPFQGTEINYTNRHSTSDKSVHDAIFYTNYWLCDIEGNKLDNNKFNRVNGPVTMNVGVQNPTTIYKDVNGAEGQKNWTTFTGTTNRFTPQKNMGIGKKTIFDPCPPGYCIPVFDAFDFLNSNIWINNTDGIYSPPLIAFRPTSENSGGNNNVPSRTMCAFQTNNSSGTLEAVFPCQGNLNPEHGLLEVPVAVAGDAADARGYYWVLDRKADDREYGLVYLGGNVVQRVAPVKNQGQALGVGNGYRGVAGSLKHDHWPRPNTFEDDTKSNQNGYKCWVYCYAGYRENFSASRGHSIRCVQEP